MAGDAAAQYALGDLLAGCADENVARQAEPEPESEASDGSEQAVELEEACRWWAQAATGGEAKAVMRLGSVAESRGDYRTAVKWYMTAADAQPPVDGLHEALDRTTRLMSTPEDTPQP